MRRCTGEDLADFDEDACVAAMQAAGRALVWGVDINIGHNHGSVPAMTEATRRAVAAAAATGTPVLFGMRRASDLSFAEQLVSAALLPCRLRCLSSLRYPTCWPPAIHV